MRSRSRLSSSARHLLIFLLFVATAIVTIFFYEKMWERKPRPPLSATRTIAGAPFANNPLRFVDPFGVAVARDQMIYLTDGDSGRLWQIAPDGSTKLVAENLNVPSALAITPDGLLVVAETGSHTITRVDPRIGQIVTIAGVKDRAGFADGNGTEAMFNGPVGVAVGVDGTIYVADTYNDRIRAIVPQGRVRTIAGGEEPGFADAAVGANARFDTPCGIAVAVDGALIIADTGNHRLRRVGVDGVVTTIAGTGEAGVGDGSAAEASFDGPTALTVGEDGAIYVADAGGSALRVYSGGPLPVLRTLVGGKGRGLLDGALDVARLNRPSGAALSPDGNIIVADTGNRLLRAVVREDSDRGSTITREAALALRPTADEMRVQAPPRWPYDPPERPREIAATFGEIRGEITALNKEAFFHNGLDIPGAYGETVRAVRAERVLRPLPVEDAGGASERIRFPQLGYIHLRVGRDISQRPFNDDRFRLRYNAEGKVAGVRVRRGAFFAAGDALGTLNNQYHVHLVAGPSGSEVNGLAALQLPGVKDTVAPVIEKDGVSLLDRSGQEIRASSSKGKGKGAGSVERIPVQGDVSIVVRAYDQMDNNAARRRLGLFRLGYQILQADGTAAPGFTEPLMTISFETLPDDWRSASYAYAEGSRSGASGITVFAYIVTNTVRDRTAAEGFWHASELAAGDYTVRVFAEDFFGNRTTHDTPVRISPR
ncbi:MAG TPA: SMP-30/gluconolactonase/LRE family protein [Pyrinomonadaceae bacterium]|nr:SMP-30/gluconolactonase/LRE family protein [Pyrinomonadaceae bacterium]